MLAKLNKEKIITGIKTFGKTVKAILPSILISAFIMISIAIIFGTEHAILGVLFLFFQIMSQSTSFNITKFAKSSIIVFIMGILASFAGNNIIVSIVLNFIIPFLLIILFSDDFNPKGYFIYGFFFILLQTTGLPISRLPETLLAMAYGLTILLVFNFIMYKIKKPHIEQDIISNGLNITIKRLKLLSKKRLDEKTPNPMPKITAKLSKYLYMVVEQKTGIFNNNEDCYFNSMLFLERINGLIDYAAKNYDKLTDSDLQYFRELAYTFQDIQSEYNVENSKNFTTLIDDFLANNSLSDEDINYDWIYTIKKYKIILKTLSNKQKYKGKAKEHLKMRADKVKNCLTLDTPQMRFAIRTALCVGIANIISHMVGEYTHFGRSYWVVITVYSMMLEYHEDEKVKIKNNLIGTLIGTILFSLVFQFIPESFGIIFMFVCFTFIFSLRNDILSSVIGSQLALVLTSPIEGKVEVVAMRCLLVVLAAILAYLVDKFILYTDNTHAINNKMHHLLRTDRLIVEKMEKTIVREDYSFKYLKELMLSSYLLENAIIAHEKIAPEYTSKNLCLAIAGYNRSFILSAEQIITMYENNDYDDEELKKDLLIVVTNMKETLADAELAWQKIIGNDIDAEEITKIEEIKEEQKNIEEQTRNKFKSNKTY